MIRIAKTENGLVKGLPAADPRITSLKEFLLRRHRLERTGGALRKCAKIGKE